MNQKYAFLILALLLMASIGYRQWQARKPSFVYVTLASRDYNASFLSSAKQVALYDQFPTPVQKLLQALPLQELLDKEKLYKIITPDALKISDPYDSIALSSLDQQSEFIHIALGNQVQGILNKFFGSNPQVLILELDRLRLADTGHTITMEANKPGGQLFPHLYGKKSIENSAIDSIIDLKKLSDGAWSVQAIIKPIKCTCPF